MHEDRSLPSVTTVSTAVIILMTTASRNAGSAEKARGAGRETRSVIRSGARKIMASVEEREVASKALRTSDPERTVFKLII
jgi:hypothetical protein